MTSTLCTLYLELTLQVLCESRWFISVRVVQGCEGVGDIPGVRGVQGGICMFRVSRLDWHKNSDLRSKSATGTT